MRKRQATSPNAEPHTRLLVIWGKFDPSFDSSELEAYRSDVAVAEVRVLEAGHFAIATRANGVADWVAGFMRR